MENLTLILPAECLVGVRIPPKELLDELHRRLVAALFSDGILSGASACRMEGMEKAESQHMLGSRGIVQPLAVESKLTAKAAIFPHGAMVPSLSMIFR